MTQPHNRITGNSILGKTWYWFRYDILGIIGEMRFSYLPPLMVYFAAGISGFTGIVESFFIKKELGLSAAFLASLGFWAGLPWALKMVIGHLVDLFWRQKALFVYLGASLMGISLLIMVGLTGYTAEMEQYMAAEVWFVVATLLAPVGYVIQDVVADAMTVEAVPDYDKHGQPIDDATLKRMHITMQTLGRIAIIGGSAMVAGIGGWLATTLSYTVMYQIALIIPVISVVGVTMGQIAGRLEKRRLLAAGVDAETVSDNIDGEHIQSPNWYILGGSAVFVALSISLGISGLAFKKEIIFLGSLSIIGFLIHLLIRQLDPIKQREILGTAIIIFVFRAMPGLGAGAGWWQIDVLEFNEAFFGTLRQVSSILAIVGLFVLRGWMTRRPIPYLIVFLSVYTTIMMLPFLGMYHGLHIWTEEHFGFGARTIAIIDTMADSPLGQVVMVPMLAWIAREAPSHQKATYFAIMAAFTNLALSASNLTTNYLNRIFIVERGDYSELGMLMVTAMLISLFIPIATVLLVNRWQRQVSVGP